jgi:hemerythrin-like metal-binding protein
MDEQLRLGFDPLDDVHEEFARILEDLLAASDSTLSAALDAMEVHLSQHFSLEDRWMTETAFPPSACHIDEHAAVMKSVHDVQAFLREGREGAIASARGLAEALRDWFPGHATHLDSALAHWMFKRRFGGKPVVLRPRVRAE